LGALVPLRGQPFSPAVAELWTLGHFTRMKTLPTNRQEWLRLLSVPFKTFVFGYGFIYPVWLHSLPGRPGSIGGPDYRELEMWAVGYFFTFTALLCIGIIQKLTNDRRGAVWSFVFAALALFIAAGDTFHPYYR